MAHAKFSTVVKAVCLRYAIAFVLLLTAVYWMGIYPWMTNWGSTATERQMALPDSEANPTRTEQATMALTINAPQAVVWQWLVQIGQDRAGFYSYTWLENLVGANIHNANEVHPEWQTLAVGDTWRLVPPEYLWGMGEEMASPVLISEPDRVLVLAMFGTYVIMPLNEHMSRLIVRGETGAASPLQKLLWDPIVFTMTRRMLLGLKARAEGRPDAPGALLALARIGWASAGLVVAGLFACRRRRFCLLLPMAAALPALLTSNDVQAGLAAFIAVGSTLLGFLNFGNRWWGVFLVSGSIVMLTLLLAPEAYVAIGLVCIVLLLAALAVTVAGCNRAPAKWRLSPGAPAQ